MDNQTMVQTERAKRMAQVLISVPNDKRAMLRLLAEAMMIGAELAEGK